MLVGNNGDGYSLPALNHELEIEAQKKFLDEGYKFGKDVIFCLKH